MPVGRFADADGTPWHEVISPGGSDWRPARLTAAAGFDPAAGVDLWRPIEAKGGRLAGFPSMHPTHAAPIEAVEEMLPEVGRAE